MTPLMVAFLAHPPRAVGSVFLMLGAAALCAGYMLQKRRPYENPYYSPERISIQRHNMLWRVL